MSAPSFVASCPYSIVVFGPMFCSRIPRVSLCWSGHYANLGPGICISVQFAYSSFRGSYVVPPLAFDSFKRRLLFHFLVRYGA